VHFAAHTESPHSPEQLFELIADIERYPEFMPGWREVVILARRSDSLEVRQGLSIGGIKLEFTTRAELHRPTQIRIYSSDSSGLDFSLVWSIIEAPPLGSRVTCEVDLQPRLVLADKVMAASARLLVPHILQCLEDRAREIYG
jgi:coenzyme Q-binding protein COQ10